MSGITFVPSRALPTSWRGFGLGWLIALLAMAPAQAEVSLELDIPPAKTYVLGDAIPLWWRFQNQSAETLAFMWEGCCRLNGQLKVTAGDRDLTTTPPGQALAHMFARADELEPRVPKGYETKVSDWVQLPGTGTYHLVGTYRGVLPSQFPQVRRGLALWRDAAVSAPVRLSVLSVADYFQERTQRERQRGLRVALRGPDRLEPLRPASFDVVLENLSDRPMSFSWPDACALWVLDSKDARVAPSAVISGAPEALIIPGKGTVVRRFEVSADRFEGEPLGDYRMFVDVSEDTAGGPRLPSELLSVAWRLDRNTVADLVVRAASGARTGARNAPLKLLRVYLGELRSDLRSLDLDRLDPAAQALADRLAAAADLKVLAPRPGRVDIGLSVPKDSPPQWTQEPVASVLGGVEGGLPGQLGELLRLRRHLGWEVAVVLEPDAEAPVSRVLEVAGQFAGQRSDLAEPVSVRVAMGGTNAPARVLPDPLGAWAPGGPEIRIHGRTLQWSADGREFGNVGRDESEHLRQRLAAGETLRARAGMNQAWGECLVMLRPLLLAGSRVVVAGLGP